MTDVLRIARNDDDRIAEIMACLLPLHSALTPDWIVDAACTAAERALGAQYAFLFLEEQDGRLDPKLPASDLRRRSVQRGLDAFGEGVLSRKMRADDVRAVARSLESNTPVTMPLQDFFGPLIGEAAATAAARKLGTATACAIPLHTAGERPGMLIALVHERPDDEVARLLGEHIACAIINLRQAHNARHQGVIDIARSVFDARKIEADLQRELTRAKRYKRECSIVVLEATNMRLLRERFGAFLPQQLLQSLGEGLAQHARGIDTIGAYKESGYTMILTEATAQGAEIGARRLQGLAEGLRLEGEDVPGLELHVVAGWATCPADGETTDALFGAAERRMYGAQSQVA